MAFLSRRYFEGRTRARDASIDGGQRLGRMGRGGGGFLDRGLEASLMSELGAFDEGELERSGRGIKVKKIRFQL